MPFVGGGAAIPEVTTDGLHAVMLIALARITDTFGRLGGGSIVSPTRIITSAALVRNAANVRMWFYRDDIVAGNRLQSAHVWIQPSGLFEFATLENDIAVITFRSSVANTDIFKASNIIKIVLPEAAETAATVVGYGFTTAQSEVGSDLPLASAHTVTDTCPAEFNPSDTHICATATTNALCPGDQGNGLFTGTGINRRLVNDKDNLCLEYELIYIYLIYMF